MASGRKPPDGMVTGPPGPDNDGVGFAIAVSIIWGVAIVVLLGSDDGLSVLKTIAVALGLTIVGFGWSRARFR